MNYSTNIYLKQLFIKSKKPVLKSTGLIYFLLKALKSVADKIPQTTTTSEQIIERGFNMLKSLVNITVKSTAQAV